MPILYSNIFFKNIKAYNANVRLIINQGGTSSSKTYSILQLIHLIASHSKKQIIISVVSQSIPHLRLGVIRDFQNILISNGIIPDTLYNRTQLTLTYPNAIVEFFSSDNIGKVHGPRRDILYINECNHIDFDIFDHLSIRTKQCIFLDFNPTSEFWVHTDLMEKNIFSFIQSTYKDNPMLDERIVKDIESKKDRENWWRVYGLGEIGFADGVIFTNWTKGEFNNYLPFGYGLDFGYNPDPDALIKVAIDNRNKTIYLKEIFYINEQTQSKLIDNLKNNVRMDDVIIADCAENRLIKDISNSNFNIIKSIKGNDSVRAGIKIMQDYKLIVSPDSFNLIREINNYIYSDTRAGIPIDNYNHLLDAARYYIFYMTRNYDNW